MSEEANNGPDAPPDLSTFFYHLDQWEKAQEAGIRSLKRWILVVFVFAVVSTVVLGTFMASLQRQKCGEAFANAEYDATTPVQVAQKRLNAADAAIWAVAQRIFSQTATQADYALLRHQIAKRNTLWADLLSEQAKNPIPPPPDEFC